MHKHTFVRSLELPVSAEEAFAWHELPGALARLMPPWEHVEMLSHTGGIESGARVEMLAGIGPLSVRWVAEHCDYQPGQRFVAGKLSRMFANRHRVTAAGYLRMVEARPVVRPGNRFRQLHNLAAGSGAAANLQIARPGLQQASAPLRPHSARPVFPGP